MKHPVIHVLPIRDVAEINGGKNVPYLIETTQSLKSNQNSHFQFSTSILIGYCYISVILKSKMISK